MEQRYIFKAKAINRIEGYNYRTAYNNGDWVEGFITAIEPDCAIMTNREGISGIEVDKETICQCLGDEDCYGDLIFEGDIVIKKDVDGDCYNKYEIIFLNQAFCLEYIGPCEMRCPLAYDEYEIIGNKWDE